MDRTRLDLNGVWTWTRQGHAPRAMTVPSSYHPVGSAVFEREFTLPGRTGEKCAGRWLLVFEGIAYHGLVKVNGRSVGEPMLPYSHYEFDITKAARPGVNRLWVQIDDTQVPFGPSYGWENWAGIIREVYLEQRDELHVAAAHLRTDLDATFAAADCTLALSFSRSLPAGSSVAVTLTECDTGRVTTDEEFEVSGATDAVSWRVAAPRLWSPDTPVLYLLSLELRANGQTTDTWSHRVGFRQIRCVGTHFEINGTPLFLKGMCRHDQWNEQGFTLTREQMRTDVELIKEMGCNFIRQVHYPHHPYLADLADEYGLLITGEPGIWWHDLNKVENTEPALKILELLVRRDWNHPSILAWLLANESTLRQPFVSEGAKRIRALDPTHLVSFANCDSNERTKQFFTEAGFDFYTQHPYSFEPISAMKAMEVLNDKPLVFTEWGGYFIRENEQGFNEFKRVLTKAWRERKLAGISYWCFADYRQYVRGWPPCRKGALIDGMVDERRVKRPEYMMMQQLFRAMDEPEPGLPLDPPERFAPYVNASPNGRFSPIDLNVVQRAKPQTALWESLPAVGKETAGRWLPPRLLAEHFPGGPNVGPVPFALPEGGLPLVVGGEVAKVSVPVKAKAKRLHFLGQVTTITGYPVQGTWGAPAALYRIGVKGGKAVTYRLKHGEDLVRGDLMWEASRTDPQSANAPVVLRWWLDTEYGYCQVALLTIELGGKGVEIGKIDFESLDEDFYTCLYAVTLEA